MEMAYRPQTETNAGSILVTHVYVFFTLIKMRLTKHKKRNDMDRVIKTHIQGTKTATVPTGAALALQPRVVALLLRRLLLVRHSLLPCYGACGSSRVALTVRVRDVFT